MKLFLLFFTMIISILLNSVYAANCTPPKNIKTLEDYDIIATNTSNISTADYFTGDNLNFTFNAHPKKQNKVSIDHKTGKLKIDAEKTDNFDVIIKVKNKCGAATGKFNVQIDEDI